MEEQKIGYAQEERIEIWGARNDKEINIKLVEVDRDGKQVAQSNLLTLLIEAIPNNLINDDDSLETIRLSKPLELFREEKDGNKID